MKGSKLRQFERYVSSVHQLTKFLLGGAAVVVPLADLFAELGPPWPGRIATPTIACVIEAIVLILIFNFGRKLSRKQVDISLGIFTTGTVLFLFGYLLLHSLLIFYVPPDSEVQIKGLVLQEPVKRLLRSQPGMTLEQAIEGAEYRPDQIWETWSISVATVILLAVWLVFLANLAALFAVFTLHARQSRAAPASGPRSQSSRGSAPSV